MIGSRSYPTLILQRHSQKSIVRTVVTETGTPIAALCLVSIGTGPFGLSNRFRVLNNEFYG